MLTTESRVPSREVEAVRAELLCRGVLVLDEDEPGHLVVASETQAVAERAVAQVLGNGFTVEWVGRTHHQIVPARVLGYEYFPVNTIYLHVEATADERVDGSYVAEDEERVVVAAFKCSPQQGERGPKSPGLERVLLDGYLDGRPVIDALTGEILRPVDG